MFGSATLMLLGLLLAAGLLLHHTPLVLLALVLLLAAGLSKIWESYCLRGLEYRRHLSQRRVGFGESVELEIELINRKLLPLPWLEIDDEIPRELAPSSGRLYPSHKPGRALLSSLITVRPYERVRRRYTIVCQRRGEHVFGPVRLRTGDLFGLVWRDTVIGETDRLVVAPRVVPLTALGLPARQPLGDLGTKSWLFADPSRIAAVREYRAGDSLRQIHWPASARAQRLQAKVYEPTTSHKLMIFLNLASSETPAWSVTYDPDVVELGITSAASIAAWGAARRYQIGLATNGMHRLSRATVGADPSGGPGHLPRILEALARLRPFAIRPFERTLMEGARRLAFGTTIVVVSALLLPPVAAMLQAMRRRGHPITLVITGREPASLSLNGIVIRRVGPPEAWREAAALSLGGA